MLRSLPTLTAALTNLEGNSISSRKDGKRKKSSKLQSRQQVETQEVEEDEDDEGVDEMQVFQSQIEQSVVRASKALKEIDNVHMHNAQPSPPTLAPSSSGGGRKKKKSNTLQFIDDQSERLKTSLPIEYYTRQLNHKRVFRQIVEVDERVDFSARTWRSAMTDFGLGTDPALALATGSDSLDPTPRAATQKSLETGSKKKKEEEEEEDGYNSDEMNRRLKQMEAFSATRGDEHGAKDRLSVFQAKARRHLLRALEVERRRTDSQILSLNQSIHSLDQQVAGLRKQLDAAELALKERANTERMIKQVVEVRYSFSLQTLHDRIEEQNEKIAKQSDSLALSQGYNTKVREIYHELARKGRAADPFVKKRAANLLKGLLKLLDEKESAIQKSREEAIRLAFEKISSDYRQGRVVEKEEAEMARLLEEITQDMTNYEAALVVEKEEYKVKVRALREMLEEMDIKLVKNETILAEHARAERRQAHLANKRLSASTRRPSTLAAAETEVKVLSNEEYIQKMADHFMLMTGGDSGAGVGAGAGARVAIGSRAKKRRPTVELKDSLSSSSSGSSSENEIDEDGGEVKSSKKNKRRERLPPLCDQETDSLLHVTVNEEERRSLTAQSLQPMVVIHPTENYRETREEAAASRRGSVKLLSVDSNNSAGTGGGGNGALPTTFTMISDSDSDSSSSSSSSASLQIVSQPPKKLETQPKSVLRVTTTSLNASPGEQQGQKEEIKTHSKPTVQFADLNEGNIEEQNVSVTLAEAMKEPGATISSSSTTGNRRNVQSEMATACYIKIYEEHLLKNPHHNFRRTAPRLQTLTLQGTEGGRRGSSKNNSNPSTSPTNPRKNSLNATAWLADNQFQFTVTECSRVVLEIVSKLKACSCIDLVDTIHIVKTLNEVVKVYQSLSEDPNQLMALKYKLHYISIQLIQLICTKAPKILLVANKKAVLIDILQYLLAIVAVVQNCTIPNWQIQEPLGIIADPYRENAFTHFFVEGLNQQVVFMLLGGYDELSKDNAGSGSSPAGQNKIIRRASQYATNTNEVKPNVRRFSQQLLHYSQALPQQNSLRHDDNDPGSTGGEGGTGEDFSPTLIIQNLIALIKRQFKGVPLPEVIHGYFLVIDEEISGYLKVIAGRQKQQRDRGLPSSSAYDIEHYLSLYLIELFLFATFNQKLMRIEKFHQNVEKIKNHGYNINQSKSSYILELPVINVFHFDEFYMRIRYPEIVPAILTVNLLKSVVYQDVSKRLLLLNIHGTNNPEARRGSTLTSEGTDANGMSRLPDLQYLSVTMPIEAEIEMRSLSRKEGVGGTRTQSATSTGVRGANNSKKGNEAEVKSYATTYLMQKYQIGITSTTAESSAIEISQTSIPTASKIVLSGEDAEEDMKLENVLAIPNTKLDNISHSRSLSLSGSMSQSGSQSRLSTGRNTAYLTAEERQTLPKTVYQVHEKWIADMRNYLHYLSKQIYKLLWSGVQHPGQSPVMAAKKRSLYQHKQSVLLPERLIYRVLSHIDNIHKIINTFSEDGEDMIYQLENEYQNCIMQLMLAQRKIYNIIYTITWPLRKKLIYLQNRYSSVLAENVNKINTIKELTKSNNQMKTNIEDLQRSLNILKYEKGVETFVERRGNTPDAPKGGWKQISLMQHSQNVQKLIVDYLKTETTNKATLYKQKVEILTSMLYKFRTEYDDLRIQTVGLLNSNHALYKTLPAQFMRDELIQDIYDINYSMGGLFGGVNELLVDDNSLSVGQGVDLVGAHNQFLPLRGKKKKMMKHMKPRQASNLTQVPSDLTDSVVTDYLTNHRLQAILDKFNKHASQAMMTGEEDGLTNAIPMYDDMSMYGPEEVVEALRRQQQFIPEDYEAMRKLKAKYRRDQFQTLPIKLFAFGKRIELGLQSQTAMKEDLQKFLREAEERQRQDRSFLFSLGGEGFQGHKGQEPHKTDASDTLLSLRGAKVKIALPTNANKTKAFFMSQLPTTPIYVLEKQRRLYEPTPLNLAKLMDIQHLLLARKQQLDAEQKGENVAFVDGNPPVIQFDDELSVASVSMAGESVHDSEQPPGTDLPPQSPDLTVPPPFEGKDAMSSRISSHRTTRLRHSHILNRPEKRTKLDSAPPYVILPVHSANIRPRKSELRSPMKSVKEVKVDGIAEEEDGEQAEIPTGEGNDNDDDAKNENEDRDMLVMGDSIDSADLPPIVEKQNLQHDPNGRSSSVILDDLEDDQPDNSQENQTDQLLLMEDPTTHAMRDLSRMEANLSKEVKHLIANLHTFRQALKTSQPSPTFYQIALGRKRKFAGFILGDKRAKGKAIAEMDKKVFNPITWPVFADDWHLQMLRKFEQEDAEKEAHDAQLFNDISLEDTKEDNNAAAHTISSNEQPIKKAGITPRTSPRRTSKDGGLSVEALSSILSFQRGQPLTSSFRQAMSVSASHSHSHSKEESDSTPDQENTKAAPPKDQRSTSSFTSPRIKRMMANS